MGSLKKHNAFGKTVYFSGRNHGKLFALNLDLQCKVLMLSDKITDLESEIDYLLITIEGYIKWPGEHRTPCYDHMMKVAEKDASKIMCGCGYKELRATIDEIKVRKGKP